MRVLTILLSLCVATPAFAKPGFSIGFGGGYARTRGEVVPVANLVDSSFIPDPTTFPLNSKLSRSPAAMFRLNYNLFGLIALEGFATGQGLNVFNNDKRRWSAQWQAGGRLYPLGLWQHLIPGPLQGLEVSVFGGLGMAWHVYIPKDGSNTFDSVAWQGPVSPRFGVGGEYFFTDHFKISIDYNWAKAKYDTFVFNMQDGVKSELVTPVENLYQQLFITLNFHFEPQDRNPKPAYAPPPPPPAAPAPASDEPATADFL